jgi:hypothetical protein
MTAKPNPLATEHLPFFITAPGEADVLYHVALWFLVFMAVISGIVFFRIQSFPKRMARRGKKVQAELVAVLCLTSLLFTDLYLWFAALLLAHIDIPDYSTPFNRMAAAVEKVRNRKRRRTAGVSRKASNTIASPAVPDIEKPVAELSRVQA